MNLKSLLAWVSGSKSAGAPGSARGRRAASRKRPTAERRLTLESLEGRDLMAVEIMYEEFKSLTFDGPLRYSGIVRGSSNGSSVRGEFHSESASLAGELRFADASRASGPVALDGTTVISIGNNIPVERTESLKADGDGGAFSKGNFSAHFGIDRNKFGGADSPITLTGKLNSKDFSATGKITFPLAGGSVMATGNWSAALLPSNPAPASFQLVGEFKVKGPNAVVMEGGVFVGGPVQPAPSPTTPIANVVFSWADAAGNSVGTLKDKVPIYWVSSVRGFDLSKLPVPPPTATQLIMAVTYQGKTTAASVPLPPPSHINISDAVVVLPPGGKGTMQFIVTLLSPTLTNVSFQYATIDGTGVVNQDYVKKSGTLTFKPGGSLTQTITVSVKDDRDGLLDSFNLVGSNPVGGVFDEASGQGTILAG